MAEQPLINDTEKPSNTERSLWGQTWRAFVFWVLPLILIAVGVWLGGDVFAALQERMAVQGQYNQNIEEYEAEATAAALEDSASTGSEYALMSYRPDGQDPTSPPLEFATNTAAPAVPVTLPAVNTPIPTSAPPTATPISVEPLVLPTVLLPQSAPEDVAAPTAVPTPLTPITRDYDLVNIALLGSDEEITADNTVRTDTMIIVSINRDTGTVSMMSLPRDMYVYIPSLGMNRLNVTYGWGENVGWEPGGGFGLFRQTILYNFGINVHYYAKVNITEFEQIVDLVGGVDIAVDCAIQD